MADKKATGCKAKKNFKGGSQEKNKIVKNFLLNKKVIFLSNIALATLWGGFAWRHIAAYRENPGLFILLFVLVESVLVFVFLFRKKPTDISVRPADWVAALLGTFAPLLFIPAGFALHTATGNVLLLAGTIVVFLAYLSLNRSFGIVPASRGIQMLGLYRMVRHPMYLGYIVLDMGYLLLHATSFNLFLFVIIVGSIAWRIHAEETFLGQTNNEYAQFKKQTRFALIPFIF